MNDCIYFDKKTGGCKKHSDWSDSMPILAYCLESPCGDYRPLKDDNMDDLISRSAAIEALTDAMCMTGHQSRAIDAVRFLPTVEAVPVVRCKDCARSRPLRDGEIGVFEPYCLICTCPHGCGVAYPEHDMDDRVVLPTSFCSYGYRLHNETWGNEENAAD